MKIPKGKLVPEGELADGKEIYIGHTANDGFQDLRITICTDDVDGLYAKRMAKELIRRWNSCEKP